MTSNSSSAILIIPSWGHARFAGQLSLNIRAKQGIQVDVITAIKPGLATEETINNVQVYRVGGTFVDNLRSKLNKSDPYVNQNHQQQASSHNRGRFKPLGIVKTFAVRSASYFHHGIWKNIWWPDMTCLWYFAIMRRAKQLIAQNQYDAIITSSPSFTAHVAGYRLKKKYPNIKWLVDIGDPFCFVEDALPNNRRLYGRWNYAFERRVFKTADQISVTTQPTAAQYSNLFPESAEKIHVIPPLISVQVSDGFTSRIFPDDDKIRLVFTGSLYQRIRRPDFLLRLFDSLLKTSLQIHLELHFFGHTDNCKDSFDPYEYLINQKIFIHGLVDRETALRAMEESDVLVNISNNTRYQLPSKVVEYTNTGKPIINIAQIEQDSSTKFFRDYPSALCLLDQDGIPTSQHIKTVTDFLNPPSRLNDKIIEAWMSRFTIDTIAAQYGDLL